MKNKTTMFTSPLYITLPRKTKSDRKISLNLNYFRNLHYQTNNQSKKVYFELMRPQLRGIFFFNPIEIEFVLYKSSKRKIDRSNIICIVEKFFCDILVTLRTIEDDSDEFIKSTTYRTGGVDKDNPRVEIFVKEVK